MPTTNGASLASIPAGSQADLASARESGGDPDGDAGGSAHAARPRAQRNNLQQLANAILGSGGEDRLAIDILVNLAAYPGCEGREARQALQSLYDQPGSGNAANDAQIRSSVLRAARSVCELALVTAPAISGNNVELPLSVTVAALACRCPVPDGGQDVTQVALTHIERQLAGSATCPLASRIVHEHRSNKS